MGDTLVLQPWNLHESTSHVWLPTCTPIQLKMLTQEKLKVKNFKKKSSPYLLNLPFQQCYQKPNIFLLVYPIQNININPCLVAICKLTCLSKYTTGVQLLFTELSGNFGTLCPMMPTDIVHVWYGIPAYQVRKRIHQYGWDMCDCNKRCWQLAHVFGSIDLSIYTSVMQ